MWFEQSVIYQIYPLGLCGAPAENDAENDGAESHRILRILDWIDHIKATGANCILFNPVFESDRHGYDTRDYLTLDKRLGTNEDFAQVCQAIHEAGMKVMLDGVFNHVGRGFWAFRDVQEKKWDSPYKDWFHISFDGNSPYHDDFWYEGWEGHYELVKLNLNHPDVVSHQFHAIRSWVEQFDIDGLRLDVAYCLTPDYLKQLRSFTASLKDDFVLMGETLHGDYKLWMNDEMCHSVTNYECYKGLYSSFNSMNMFEVGHSLARQFGPEQWTMYKNAHLLSFADNHDVNRIASILNDKNHLKPLYGLLFGMPGVPCIYYGSEWGIEGEKNGGDAPLRPEIELPQSNELTEFIAKLAKAHKENEALCYGSYRNVMLTNKQIIFERRSDSQRILVAINAENAPYTAHFNAECGQAVDLISGNTHDFGGGSEMPPYSVAYWLCER
ncbi:MAG: alpha-amylase family glycosyl hydrolase [Lachnospiraceae bacterium]|nr:alpha-amylase family glycosyl hydrolase [Lachnospiraceae bacterium]